QCNDTTDNDGDGLIDLADPGCLSATDDNESDGTSQCQDGIDNDSDGANDYPNDFSCSDANDNDETNPKAQCQDGIDNDGDGKVDFPQDPGCTSKQDNDEFNPTPQFYIQKFAPNTPPTAGVPFNYVVYASANLVVNEGLIVEDDFPA